VDTEIDIEGIHISEIVRYCFHNEVYVKPDVVNKNRFRICAHTPSGVHCGTTLYQPEYKPDMAKMKEKIDELYKFFYIKLKKQEKKLQQSIDT
jgi:hypothetical protein